MRLSASAYAAVAIGVTVTIYALVAAPGGAQDLNTARMKQVAAVKGPFMDEQVVWGLREGGIGPHFVYGLAVTKKGTVLAFCEGRIRQGDHTPHHLLLKRSADSGRTWSDDIFIERSDGAFFKNSDEGENTECWANPAAVVDQKTGRAFIFYVLNEGTKDQKWTRVFYRYSDDDGKTWLPDARHGGRIEITSIFKDNPYGWTFHMPGPGHGIQLARQRGAQKSKNGRLIAPFWNRSALSGKRNYGVFAVYSDDHGRTWKLGGVAGADYGMNESRIAELPDGKLVINGRGSAAEHNPAGEDTLRARLYAYSEDGGESFSKTEARHNLSYFRTDSSLISYPLGAGRDALLFSYPGSRRARERMTVSVSLDQGKSWAYHKLIYEGPSTYSDLVVLPDRTIGLLYGKDYPDGEKSGGATPKQVVFARFNYEWLTGAMK
jgi:sialidase-1